ETHSSGTKQDHGKAESHGGAEHDTHKAAAHGAEAAHDAGGGAHHDAGHDTGHDAGGVAHRDTGHDDGGVAHRDTGHDDGGVAHHDTGHDAGGVVHHDAGHDAGAGAHQKEHTPDKHVTSTHGTKKHLKKEETHSIFQGYTKESSKSKSHIFSKKHGKSLGSGIRPVVYVKSKWAESGINKIAMSVICYIFVTQMWLSVIAFFGFIVWRIKQKNLPG
ncbi:MAG: hypothetical protein GY941_07655, partial [Planctomycetes bacterium]|nr:hypothetical protein [Planctomycetota bacterium]